MSLSDTSWRSCLKACRLALQNCAPGRAVRISHFILIVLGILSLSSAAAIFWQDQLDKEQTNSLPPSVVAIDLSNKATNSPATPALCDSAQVQNAAAISFTETQDTSAALRDSLSNADIAPSELSQPEVSPATDSLASLPDSLQQYAQQAAKIQMLLELLEQKQMLMEARLELMRQLELLELIHPPEKLAKLKAEFAQYAETHKASALAHSDMRLPDLGDHADFLKILESLDATPPEVSKQEPE